MQLSALLPFTFTVLASAVKGARPAPDPFALVFSHENYKGSRTLIDNQCTPLDSLYISGSIFVPTIKDRTIECFFYSEEDCAHGSVVISYAISETSIPTKVSDQIMAAECLYF
ncbi:uncharacterized protein Triagg1_10548 [Trichoderma aggressivum f. europaeum]|uniref:Uncharacterized protein n=1 Tax=Trichoderma aggressivum f. europaeum TaxID=173218 RepID=A0AAE1LY18_9HYPO|nr:hypothetical protein Triagg1_10548 [Trichoderma aggressivum f. europaeum]